MIAAQEKVKSADMVITSDGVACVFKCGAFGVTSMRAIVAIAVALLPGAVSAQELRKKPSGVDAAIDAPGVPQMIEMRDRLAHRAAEAEHRERLEDAHVRLGPEHLRDVEPDVSIFGDCSVDPEPPADVFSRSTISSAPHSISSNRPTCRRSPGRT